MVESGRPARATRKKPTKSYRVQDQYAFLDVDSDRDNRSDHRRSSSPPRAVEEDEDEDEDGDVFMPQDQDDPNDPDEYMDDEPFNEDSDASDAPTGKDPTAKARDEIDDPADEEDVDDLEDEAEADSDRPDTASRKKKNVKRPAGLQVSAAAAGVGIRPVKPFAKSQGTKVRNMGINQLHARGVDDWARGGGMEVRLKDLFGSSSSDLMAVLRTRDRWSGQETLPSREEQSLGRSYYVKEEAMKKQIEKTRKWYSTKAAHQFSNGQKSGIISQEEAHVHLGNSGPDSLNLLMGTIKEPQLQTLNKGSYMNTAKPFAAKLFRRGWLLNLGSKVVDAQWVPNEEGKTQYLAVAVEQHPRSKHNPLENPQAPAFSATVGFPASIQIWAFESTKRGDLDSTKEPQLASVICTDWGAPKQLRWCPIPSRDDIEDIDRVHLGLLAVIWSDGKARILDVSYSKSHGGPYQTQYVHYAKAAFEIQLPHTIPSCLHWLSGVSIAIASSAGTLGVWTLTHSSTFPTDPSIPHNPTPWFYKQIADTYILTLTSGYPSLPSFISITTADGFGKLYDLRSPRADCVSTARGRIFATAQAWHEHTQSFLMPDENYLFRNNTVRRYYTNIYSMRVESQIVCCATSPVQPGVLIGCADGLVTASNPVIKVLNSKEVPWQQIWFTHEWRPPVDQLSLKIRQPSKDTEIVSAQRPVQPTAKETPAPVENDPDSTTTNIPSTSKFTSNVSPEILSKPLTRINEGYRIKQINMQYYRPTKGSKSEDKEAIKYITIYEEPSAITCLAWNPNLKFGTWAVAGMGDGLVRVEDLGV